MDLYFSFKHMEVSDSLKNYAENKIKEKLIKFISKPVKTQVVLSTVKHQHVAQCIVNGGDGFNVQVEHSCEDMYGSIDKMVDKLEVQLKRHKEKLKKHKNSGPKIGFLGKEGGKKSGEMDYENEEVDAEDILKFEMAKRRMNNSA